MNTAKDIISYAAQHRIRMVVNGDRLVFEGNNDSLTDQFLEAAKQSKPALIKALSRWDPELAAEGYIWCYDCKFWGGQICQHPDNPFRNQCPQAPRICRWYEAYKSASSEKHHE